MTMEQAREILRTAKLPMSVAQQSEFKTALRVAASSMAAPTILIDHDNNPATPPIEQPAPVSNPSFWSWFKFW